MDSPLAPFQYSAPPMFHHSLLRDCSQFCVSSKNAETTIAVYPSVLSVPLDFKNYTAVTGLFTIGVLVPHKEMAA